MGLDTEIPVFGRPPVGTNATVRPSAYGIIFNDLGSVAVVRTSRGVYLPGGGIEQKETAHEAVLREAREECGVEVQLGIWSRSAIDFVFSPSEQTLFEKRSTFVDGHCSSITYGPVEPDNQLEWHTPQEAANILTPPSHRWAVLQRQKADGFNNRVT
jgi:8-oxo-dGTP diphosphatase